jgi:SfnB family sulfur acquisition oxidoreductase
MHAGKLISAVRPATKDRTRYAWRLNAMASAPADTTDDERAVAVIGSAAEAADVARAYAGSIAGGTIERDRAGRAPVAELAALDASGLLGITVPASAGGPGLGMSALAEVVATIAAVDPAIAQPLQPHFLFVDVTAVWGGREQRQRLLTEVLSGGRIGNGLAERGGQHAQDLKTRLRGFPGRGFPDADGAGIRLDGRKYYTTGALTARWIGVSALDDDGRLALAFVRRDSPGVTLSTDWNVMGQRATVSGSATFTDVPVDPRLVVDYARAFAVPQQFGARSQLIHTAIQTGIARGALRDAGDFVRGKARPFFAAVREGWADRASRDPHVMYRFGQLATKVRAAEALLASAAATLDEIGLVPEDERAAARGSIAVAEAKAFASEVAAEVASGLFDLGGASAADEKHDLSRHWRNARTHASHDPVAWKYHHIGNYLLNEALPPNHGQI